MTLVYEKNLDFIPEYIDRMKKENRKNRSGSVLTLNNYIMSIATDENYLFVYFSGIRENTPVYVLNKSSGKIIKKIILDITEKEKEMCFGITIGPDNSIYAIDMIGFVLAKFKY